MEKNEIQPLISVIVPVYKVEKYLQTCIESVLAQTYTNWELILVDDGSPDNSGKICEEYKAKDDRIVVLHQINGGQANARNNALDICHGDYVTFLDSDDFLHQEALEYSLNLLLKTNADIAQFGYIRGDGKVFPDMKENSVIEEYNNHSIFLSGRANVIVWGKLYRRDILLKNKIKEGRYYEDDFTTWKWYYTANKIVVSNRALYYYTVNPNSTMAGHKKKPSFDFMDAYKERIAFFVGTGEKDLEHCSRLQLCKSLLLTYGHSNLSEEERRTVKEKYDESWKEIKYSPYIRPFYKILFSTFHLMPMLTSKMTAKLR